MKSIKIAFLFFIIFLALSSIFLLQHTKADVVKSKYFNYVEKGAKTVKTSPSTQYKLMETYPQATITVYEAGTTNIANIWADRDGFIIKANPFTADTDSFYYFYVDCGKYDIKFSGTGISVPYTYGDVFICGTIGSGTGNVSTLGGTTDFIPKWTSSTSLGDSVLYNPLNIQAGSSILFGWTAGAPTSSLDVAIGRNSAGKIEINNGTLNSLANLTLHRIEPIPTVAIPGLNFGVIADDPTNPVEGDCWYNTSLSAFRCFNGSTFTIAIGNGITSINTLTAAAQFLVVGTSGSDFNISSSTATHTFNLPDASLTARGVINTSTQTINGDKTIDDTLAISSNTANAFVYSNSLKRLVTTIAPTNGQLLIGSTGAAPTLGNITGDANISIINTAGGIQIVCATCGGSSGTIINPTDNFMPYRVNATTFGDSNLVRTSSSVTTITPLNGLSDGALRGPNSLIGNPTYSFTRHPGGGMTANDTRIFFSAETSLILELFRPSSTNTIAMMEQNTNGKFGFGNSSLLAGIMWGANGSIKFIENNNADPGSFYSSTNEIDAPINCVGGAGRAILTRHGNVRTLTLNSNRTVCKTDIDTSTGGNPSGMIITLIVIQDSTGSRTVTWDSTYKWAGGVAPTLTTTANAKDIFTFWLDGTNTSEISRSMDVK